MSSISCPKCDLTTWSTALVCKRCGHIFQTTESAAAAAPAVSPNPAVAASQASYTEQSTQHHYQQQMPSPNAFGNQANSFHQNQQNYSSFHQNQQNYSSNNQSQWSSAAAAPPPNQNYYQPHYQQQGRANYQYGNYQSPYSQSGLKKKAAIYSLIFGILSFPPINVLIGVILATFMGIALGTAGVVAGLAITLSIMLIGLFSGISALRKAGKMPQEYGGKGLAIAGISLSSFGLIVVPLIALIAIPNVLAARRAANEGSAISTMRMLLGAEQTYRATTGKGRCGDLSSLAEAGLIKRELSSGTHNGYQFLIVNLPTLNGDCQITATPKSTSDGDRSFYLSTEDSIIRAAKKDGAPATASDPALEDSSSPNTYPKIAGR